MKEGYLQLKIAEINDKCNQIEQMITMEKKKIQLLEDRVGGFKQLIKKLKEIDNFKEELRRQIKDDNKDFLEEEIKKISKKISEEIENLLITKLKKIEESIKYISNQEEKFKKQNEMIYDINKNVSYLLTHNDLFMMKLVNKAIISDREVNELHLRSSKKSGKKD